MGTQHHDQRTVRGFPRISTPAGPVPEQAPAWNRQRQRSAALVEYRTAAGTRWAAGQDRSPLAATLAAVIHAANASSRPAVLR